VSRQVKACWAGVLVMESLEHAQKRGATILAEYLGGAINCDAYHMTDPRADGLGVSSCIQLALKDAGVDMDEVGRRAFCGSSCASVGDTSGVLGCIV
jgi:3-oxoacyl-(acyl-carrier-protein) synthase